jgi:homopolymeric O-antigen transport system permease protein
MKPLPLGPDSIPQGAQAPAIVIDPVDSHIRLDLKDLWHYRELLYFMIWRDVKVRYKQTAIGASWALFQPVMTMVIFTVVFGYFARLPSDGLPYPIFAYTALLPWTYFSQALTRSAGSLVSNANLISKIYFPRLIIPLAAALSPLLDFGLTFLVLLGMMVWFGIIPTWALLMLPFFLLLAVMTALAGGLWLTALDVQYRDIGLIVPFFIQLWMFASPVAYPVSLVPERWQLLYGLNPLVGVIEGFRWAILGKGSVNFELIAISILVVVVALLSGLIYFKRTERTFADII